MDPILMEFPTEFYTKRLLIRMPKPGDGKAVYNAIQKSINELKPWMPFVHKEQSEELCEVNTRNAYTEFIKRNDLRLHIFLRETGEFIGSSGLHRINWEIPKFEIGYWIDTRYSGKGYIIEAVQGISNFAFDELKARRVEIRCDSKNEKSCRIPEKLDFTLEGILKNDDVAVNGNELRDTYIYAKVR